VGKKEAEGRQGGVAALAIWIFALRLAAIAFGCAIGLLAAGKDASFNWETAAVASTAFATAVLAGFTGHLANETRGDVRATQQLAELGRKEHELSTKEQNRRELAIMAVRRVAPQRAAPGAPVTFNVVVRNAGLSPAIYITLIVDTEDSIRVPVHGESTNDNILLPGEETTIEVPLVRAPQRPDDLKDDIQIRIRGVYMDSLERWQHFMWQGDRVGRSFAKFKAEPW
jgi:hypothetical protein